MIWVYEIFHFGLWNPLNPKRIFSSAFLTVVVCLQNFLIILCQYVSRSLDQISALTKLPYTFGGNYLGKRYIFTFIVYIGITKRFEDKDIQRHISQIKNYDK